MTDPTVAALVPFEAASSSVVAPVASVAIIEQAFTDYQTLCQRLLEPEDFQRIGRKDYPKKSAWRKLAVAFGVSFQHVEHTYERDEAGKLVRAEFVFRAVAPNGRYAEAFGAAHRDELVGARQKTANPEHDLPATAETRAKNRAASDLFGMGEVSAEEIVDRSPVVEVSRRVVARHAPPGVNPETGEIERQAGEWTAQDALDAVSPSLRVLDEEQNHGARAVFRKELTRQKLSWRRTDWSLEDLKRVAVILQELKLWVDPKPLPAATGDADYDEEPF